MIRRISGVTAGLLAAVLLMSACSSGGSAAPKAVGGSPNAGQPAAPVAPAGFDVRAENAKPGTTAWTLTSAQEAEPMSAIEGYADRISVLPGESFNLYVSTTASTFTVTAYRIGYYGGTQGRQIWQSPPVHGTEQRGPSITSGLNEVTANWRPSLRVTAAGWPEGDYLLKLRTTRSARYVPITVRSAQTTGRVVIVNAVTTWQAYNLWGGYDLYTGPHGYSDRARAVSFDRPYDTIGADKFLNYDQPLVSFAEKLGIPVAYETDIELSTSPQLFSGARAVLTMGHDEYWTQQMRDNMTHFRDAGVNIAFFGANAAFRHVRLGDSPLGPNRIVICYKSSSEDPMSANDPAESTQDWRDPPDPRPENVLTGVYYECNPANAPYVVYDPTSWMFAGTRARKGSSYPGLVGVEYDRVVSDPTTPHPIQVISHSPITCGGHHSYADSAYYTVPSGAGVFATGTMRWVCAIGSGCGDYLEDASRYFARQVTTNILEVFAAGPAGRVHPALDNTAAVHPAASRETSN